MEKLKKFFKTKNVIEINIIKITLSKRKMKSCHSLNEQKNCMSLIEFSNIIHLSSKKSTKTNCITPKLSTASSLCCNAYLCIQTPQQILIFRRFSRSKHQEPIRPHISFNRQIFNCRSVKQKIVHNIFPRFKWETLHIWLWHFPNFITKEQIILKISTNISNTIISKWRTIFSIRRTTETINLELIIKNSNINSDMKGTKQQNVHQCHC